jgi:hypothetical protein
MVMGNLEIHMQKTKNLNTRPECIKLLEEKVTGNVQDFQFSNGSLDVTPIIENTFLLGRHTNGQKHRKDVQCSSSQGKLRANAS